MLGTHLSEASLRLKIVINGWVIYPAWKMGSGEEMEIRDLLELSELGMQVRERSPQTFSIFISSVLPILKES